MSSRVRTVRRIAWSGRLTSLDVPLLEDAADALSAAEARVAQLEAALNELVEAGDFSITSTDDVAVMMKLGQATDVARALVAGVGTKVRT